MRWLILGVFLMAMTPIFVQHDTPDKVDSEFKNMSDNLQDQSFNVIRDTPSLNDLKDGQIVVFASTGGTFSKLVWRVNQEIFTVGGSCFTVRR